MPNSMNKRLITLLFIVVNLLTTSASYAQGPGCPNVNAGADASVDCTNTCVDLTASYLQTGETDIYRISSIPYAPPFPYTGLANPISVNQDDEWFGEMPTGLPGDPLVPPIDLPFDFCFFGDVYNQIQVGSNGVVRFDVDPADTTNGWAFTEDLPNNLNPTLGEANIFGVGHDMDPFQGASNPEIAWDILGTAPCRTFVVSFSSVSHFSCTNLTSTTQIVLYETTNAIEIYIQDKPTCDAIANPPSGWNDGNAVLGIQNNDGTIAYVPPGRNTSDSPWTATDEAWRFTPDGTRNYEFNWYDDTGVNIGTANTVNVCPSSDTVYTAEVVYTNCNGNVTTVTDDVLVTTAIPFSVDLGPDQNLCEGDPDVVLNADIGSGTVTYQWALNGTDIAGETNPTYTVTSPNSGTYSVTVVDQGCNIIDDVVVTFITVPIANPITDYLLCDDAVVDGFTEFDLSVKDAEIIGAQVGITVSYHLSQADADANNNPLPNLFTNTVNPQTIYVRIESDNNTSCYNTATFDLVVTSGVTANQPPNINVCDDLSNDGIESFDLASQSVLILGGQTGVTVSYHESQPDADGDINPLLSPYINIANPQIIYVRVEDDINNTCYESTSFQLIVSNQPTAIQPLNLDTCDDPSNDGTEQFDLEAQSATVLGVQISANFSVTYHESQADADSSTNALSSPHVNIGSPQTIYVRIENNNNANCYDTTSFSLTVNPAPEATQPTDMVVCDDLSNDGLEVFDLTTQTAIIIGTQLPSDVTVTYHESLTDAETDLAPIGNPGTYTSSTQTIHVRVESTTNVTCFGYTSFDLIVNPLPFVIMPTALNACDDNADGFENFILTDKISEILNGQTGISVSFYDSLVNAQSGNGELTMPYTNIATFETLYVRLENDTTGCFNTTTLDINLYQFPIPQTPLPIVLCDDLNPGDLVENFDLTIREVDIINGELGVSVTYYETEADAESGTNAIPDLTTYTNTNTPQTIYIRVTNDTTGCYTIVELELIVNPVPDVIAVPDLIECELSTDGFFAFDLDSKTDEILNGQDPAIFSVTYHATQADAQTGINVLISPYTNLINPQQIFVNITDTTTGCDIATLSFNIEVQEGAIANMLANEYMICDYLGENDGIGQFDLTTQNTEILGPTQTTGYTVTYYESLVDAEAGVDQIPTLYENLTGNPLVIYARVDNDNTTCYETTMLTLLVELRPIIDIENSYIFCVDSPGGVVTTVSAPVIDTGLNIMDYSFVWVETGDPAIVLGTDSSFVPPQAGRYEVFVTNLTTGCEETATTQVIQSSPPDVEATVTTLAFAEVHVIEATATGDGQYEFSLDGGPWVTNNPNTNSYTFTDVSLGEHEITARDLNGCGESNVMVMVMDYPLYFTPNGDGYHDTWNIIGISNQVDAKIYIFDRYGKLLKELSPTAIGWDGTFNGADLPSSDYWFIVNYREPSDDTQKEFKAHFTLKR